MKIAICKNQNCKKTSVLEDYELLCSYCGTSNLEIMDKVNM